MAIFRVTPHADKEIVSVDVQFTNNPFGAWTEIITDDNISGYPKKFSDNRVTDQSYIRFRLTDSNSAVTDWSQPQRPISSYKPEPNKYLCYVYGRIRDPNTQEPTNSPRIHFEYVSGTPVTGATLVRDIWTEGDNYGWFIVSLTPNCTYLANCIEASINKNIIIPTAYNAKFDSL